jgi:peptide/nickel transport system permease protein
MGRGDSRAPFFAPRALLVGGGGEGYTHPAVYKYLIRRLLQAIPVLFIITMVLFLILQLQPEHPWDLLLHNPRITPQDRARVLHYYGFDQPIWVQYLYYVRNLGHFDLGTSYFSHTATLTLIEERLPNTLVLMTAYYIVTLAIAIPIGIIAAVRQYSKFDTFVTTSAFFGFSLPNFWFGLMLIILLAVIPYEHIGFTIFPTDGMHSPGWEGPNLSLAPGTLVDLAWHLVLPVIVLAVQGIAFYSRFIRGSMLEVMNQDYVRTARAKGMSETTVVLKHALRNALLPVITLMGLDIPQLFVGALITEQVFSWPGMGRLFWTAATEYDYQVLMGILTVLAILVVLGNLIADLAYSWADPRIQYR